MYRTKKHEHESDLTLLLMLLNTAGYKHHKIKTSMKKALSLLVTAIQVEQVTLGN